MAIEAKTGRLGLIAGVLTFCLLLAACGSRPVTGALAISAEPAPGANIVDILVSTTRERDPSPDTYFSGERREEGLDFAEFTVSIPPVHQAGKIEWADQAPGDPRKHFVTRNASYIDGDARFQARLDQRLSRLPKGKRTVFVFIHGYNTLFSEGLFRYAQILDDGDFPGVPVFFTWASRGKVQDYVYDLNSASIARDGLETTLRYLARSKAEKVIIVAHSMGNWLLLETGSRLSERDRIAIGRKLDHVVLAAPDIDIDLFKTQMRRMGKPQRPFVVIVSRDDKALRLSRRIAGNKERLGAYSDDEELAELGAIVINLTDFDSLDATNHSKFAQLAALGPELSAAITTSGLTKTAGSSAQGRAGRGQGITGLIGNTAMIAITLPTAIVGGSGTAVRE